MEIVNSPNTARVFGVGRLEFGVPVEADKGGVGQASAQVLLAKRRFIAPRFLIHLAAAKPYWHAVRFIGTITRCCGGR